jgi:hypothetical protein
LIAQSGLALITGEHGNRPVEDKGWPPGSAKVANMEGRLGYWEGPPFGGGEHHFLYRCRSTQEFNKALQIFASIKAPQLELVIHNGPEYSFWLKGEKGVLEDPNNRVDWIFTVWNPSKWNRLFNDPNGRFMSSSPNFGKPVSPPRIDAYIGGGSIIWQDVNILASITVIDKRPVSISPEFADGGLVRGKVFDCITGHPIGSAEVMLFTYQGDWKQALSIETDNLGMCQIAKIPAGYYEIRVSAAEHVSRKQGDYDNRRPEYYQFELGLSRTSYVKGIVVNENCKPVQDVKVSAVNILGMDGLPYWCAGDVSAITDQQGRFEIQPLPLGSLNIICMTKELHIKNSIFEQYPIPSDQIKLIVEGTSTIHGKVVIKDGQRPSGQIVLEIRPQDGIVLGKWGYSGQLKEDGFFDINGIPPGEYVISTRPNPSNCDYKPNTRNITVQSGQTYQIEVVHAD